jgi:hypothetical protein
MFLTQQRRPLTPPAPLKHFDKLDPLGARSAKERQVSPYHHVSSKLDTRREDTEARDVRQRMLSRILQRQRELSPTRKRAMSTSEGGDLDAAMALVEHFEPADMVTRGGVATHFLSSTRPTTSDVATDSFAAMQYAALIENRGAVEEKRRAAHRAQLQQQQQQQRHAGASSPTKSKSPRKGRDGAAHSSRRVVKIDERLSPPDVLRNPREVPLSHYIDAQVRALRYSLQSGGKYHVEFMAHADEVAEGVKQRRAERRRHAPVDYVAVNRVGVQGTASERAAERTERARLLEQRKHVVDAALNGWIEKFQSCSSSGGAVDGRSPSPLSESPRDTSEDDVHALRAKRLLTAVALGLTGRHFTGALNELYFTRTMMMRQRQLQVVSVAGLSLTEIHRAWANVRRQLRRYVHRYRQRKYAAPVNVVRRFLLQRRRVLNITQSVTWFRGQVIRVQRAIRAFLLMLHARRSLLTLQWISRECELLHIRLPLPSSGRARYALQKANSQSDVVQVVAMPLRMNPYAAGHILTWRWVVPGGAAVADREAAVAAAVTDLLRRRLTEIVRYEHRKRFFDAQYATYSALAAKGVTDVHEPQAPKRHDRRKLFLDDPSLLALLKQTRGPKSPDAKPPVSGDSAYPSSFPTTPPQRSAASPTERLSFTAPPSAREKASPSVAHIMLPAPPPVTHHRSSPLKHTRTKRPSDSKRVVPSGALVTFDTTRALRHVDTPDDSPVGAALPAPAKSAFKAAQQTSPRQAPRPPPVAPPQRPRNDAYYAKLLQQPTVQAMHAFIARDDRTGGRIRRSYADTQRPASPVTASMRELRRAQEESEAERLHEPFRSPVVDKAGLRPATADEPIPNDLWRLSVTNLTFAATAPLITSPAAGAHTSRGAFGGALTPRATATALEMSLRLPAVATSRLHTADPGTSSVRQPSRRSARLLRFQARPSTVGGQSGDTSSGEVVSFLVAAAYSHEASRRPRVHV